MLRTLMLAGSLLVASAALAQEAQIEAPGVMLTGVPFEVTVQPGDVPFDSASAGRFFLEVNGLERALAFDAESGTLAASGVTVEGSGPVAIRFVQGGVTVAEAASRSIPGWLSVLPPLLAIVTALLFKRVIPALFAGIWIGAWIAAGLSITGLWFGLLDSFQVYTLTAVADTSHAAIILFSFMIGGMVGIISKNGGTQGVVNRIVGWANTPRHGQLTASTLGIAIFFDDYANTLVVGNTMRPVTDRLRVSREKLAYIVDSTAAPVACVALVSTWIGYEVGLIGDAVATIPDYNEAAYSIFLNSIPYSFYPLFAIYFVFLIAWSKRDFGPMYFAEQRARTLGQVSAPGARIDLGLTEGRDVTPVPGKPQRALNAIIPVAVLILTVLGSLYLTGEGETLREIIGSADSYQALMWGSLLSVLTAVVLSLAQRILTFDETLDAWYAGLKSMLMAIIILVMAWSLAAVTDVLHTADYLVSTVSQSLPAGVLPALIFVIAAATAFATGTSWGTMGILMPLVVPLAWATLAASGLHTEAEYHHIIYSTVSAVLAGAVWGDHCSPVSDTTIMSSMASGCDHIDHVRTQLPYAIIVGLVALFVGTLPTGFGMPWWISLVAGALILTLAVRYFGKKLDETAPEVAATRAEAPMG
jgi:Na+/H+ antiporter NhaC